MAYVPPDVQERVHDAGEDGDFVLRNALDDFEAHYEMAMSGRNQNAWGNGELFALLIFLLFLAMSLPGAR